MKQVKSARCIVLKTLLVVVLSGCAARMTLPTGQNQTESSPSVAQTTVDLQHSVLGGTSGMTIHIDPQTGRILREPARDTAPLQLVPELQNAMSTSHEGLVAVPSPVPGGGLIINLEGRFQSPLVATIDSAGKFRMEHLHELLDSDNQ